MSSGYFSVGIYGQSGLVMDWFGLNDPFTQQLPIKITNAWSGTVWIQGELISPPTGVYTVYSGISMGSVNSGASATLGMTWNVNISGQTATSSPVTHALTLGLFAFTSSNYTGALASGNFAFNNTLFNRYSGVIKIFGDIYNNDQPALSVTQNGVGGLKANQIYSYAMSYILSGWESDIGSPTSITTNSGNVSVSWNGITGVTQYLLWRFSGSVDFTLYNGTTPPGAGLLNPIDLVYASSQLSFTDSGQVALQANLFRHRTWQRFQGAGIIDGLVASPSTTTYLSPPQSRTIGNAVSRSTHGFHLNKNISGTNLLGPFYAVFHWIELSAVNHAIALSSNIDGSLSGTFVADSSVLNQTVNVWYRHAIQLGSSGSLSASGTVHIQLVQLTGSSENWDDVFICAQS